MLAAQALGRQRMIRSPAQPRFARRWPTALLVAAVVEFSPEASAAQRAGGVILGIVLDSVAQTPIGDVEIRLDGVARTRSSAAGEFSIAGISPGVHELTARRLGFAPRSDAVTVQNGSSVRVALRMSPVGTALAPVVVTAAERIRTLRLAAFEERRQYGLGKFLTPEDWKGRNNATLKDVLESGVPAIYVADGKAASRRGGLGSSGSPCFLSLWVDGVRVGTRSRSLDEFPVAHVIAIEVYRGPSETPLQFGGTDASCGALVIWTGPG